MRRLSGVVVLLGVLLWSTAASAAPVTWNIVNATFDAASGGGSVSGFFVWDAVTKVLSDWSITVDAGVANDPRYPAAPTTFSAFTYDTTSSIACGFPAGPFTGQCTGDGFNGIVVSQVYPSPVNGVYGRTLSLGFTTPLTDAGGTVNIDASGNYLAYEAFSSPSGCVGNSTCNEREFATGAVTTSPIGTPEPSTVLSLGTGLVVLFGSRRKKVPAAS